MPSRYTAVPAVPFVGVEEWQSQILSALKENVELLTGTRGESDLASLAINRSMIAVSVPPKQSMVQVSARGTGVVISNSNIPILEDYITLLENVQDLANDVANVRATLEVLIRQLRG